MDKSIITFLIVIPLFSIFSNISCISKKNSEKFTIKIEEPKNEKIISLKLKKRYAYQSVNILENTLNDTCMIGVIKIPPGKKGTLFKVEFYSDSLIYKYIPYQATNGLLVFEHSFFD